MQPGGGSVQASLCSAACTRGLCLEMAARLCFVYCYFDSGQPPGALLVGIFFPEIKIGKINILTPHISEAALPSAGSIYVLKSGLLVSAPDSPSPSRPGFWVTAGLTTEAAVSFDWHLCGNAWPAPDPW